MTHKKLALVALLALIGSTSRAVVNNKRVVRIRANDINKPGGFVINSAGKYFLMRDVLWDPNNDNDAAITISPGVSNVCINLRCHCIKQNTSNTQNNNIGIRIHKDNTNISIANGSIKNISGVGIYFEENTKCVELRNLTVKECGARGSFTTIVDEEPVAAGGVFFIGQEANPNENIKIRHCMFIENTTNSAIAAGLHFTHTKNVRIENSFLNGNHGGTSVAAGLIGGISNLAMENVEAHNNNCDNTAYGIAIFEPDKTDIKNIVLKNVNAHNNRGLGSSSEEVDKLTGGGLLIEKAKDVFCYNCSFNTNFLGGGFTGDSFGICLADVHNCVMDNCLASDNTGNVQLVFGFMLVGCTNCVFKNCTANRNINSNNVLGGTNTYIKAFGFGLFAGQGNAFINCVAEENDAIAGFVAAGFSLAGSCVTVDTCLAQGNGPNCEGAGILSNPFTGGQGPDRGIIKNNCTLCNSAIGIGDLTALIGGNNINSYFNNYSFANGAAGGSIILPGPVVIPRGNYYSLPTNTPIRTWTMGSAPAAEIAGKLDNLDIVKPAV